LQTRFPHLPLNPIWFVFCCHFWRDVPFNIEIGHHHGRGWICRNDTRTTTLNFNIAWNRIREPQFVEKGACGFIYVETSNSSNFLNS
jgi:hypothetical protein